MNTLEKSLDPETFLRIHRSVIVNVRRIKELQPATARRICSGAGKRRAPGIRPDLSRAHSFAHGQSILSAVPLVKLPGQFRQNRLRAAEGDCANSEHEQTELEKMRLSAFLVPVRVCRGGSVSDGVQHMDGGQEQAERTRFAGFRVAPFLRQHQGARRISHRHVSRWGGAGGRTRGGRGGAERRGRCGKTARAAGGSMCLPAASPRRMRRRGDSRLRHCHAKAKDRDSVYSGWNPRLAADYLDAREKAWAAWKPAAAPAEPASPAIPT